jgi:hypothetical protein
MLSGSCLSEFTNNISAKNVIENGLQERIGEQDQFQFIAMP